MIKILLGGSPCTYWSIAQKNNRETEPSGMGWELFENYLIAKEKFQPDIFLYENNKSAAQPIKDEIKKRLNVWDGTLLMSDSGARYIEINSALVSAQNRQRFYVHNCGEVGQPEDRGILLRDILETGTDLSQNEKSYCLTATYGGATAFNTLERSQRTMVAEPVRIPEYSTEKARPLTASYANKGAGEGSLASECFPDNPNKQVFDYIAEPVRIGTIENDAKNSDYDSKQYRVYSPDGKSTTLCGQGGGVGAKTGLYACPYEVEELSTEYYHGNDNCNLFGKIVSKNTSNNKGQPAQCVRVYNTNNKSICLDSDSRKYIIDKFIECDYVQGINRKKVPAYEVKDGKITIKGKQYPIKLADGFYIIRKLTVTECCRLQTLPDDYCRAVSASQGYKGCGNGWTAEVIIHILSNALKDVPKDEKIVVLSMYDGIGTGRYCLDKMGFTNVRYYASEIDKYAMQIAKSNYPDIQYIGDAYNVRNDDWSLEKYAK